MKQTLLTKYRPQAFSQVVGNEAGVTALEAAVKSKNCPHAYLFTGTTGIGKTTLARIVANYLGAAITEIDAASNSGVDDSRHLVELANHKSVLASCNFYIVDECHALSKQAWQPFLKLLEDPPPYVYIALCTTEVTKVPETIKSRCFPVSLKPLRITEVQALLEAVCDLEKWEVDNNVFVAIAQAANGSARRALTILEAGHAAKSVDELASMIDAVEADNQPVIELCKYLLTGQKNWKVICGHLARIENEEEAIIVGCKYLAAVMVRSMDGQAEEAWRIITRLSDSPSWDKKVQLYSAIGRIVWGGVPF